MGFFILKQACVKANEQGSEYAQAYLFAKTLASLNRHPIIKHFKANQQAIAILCDYSNNKFKKLLHLAFTHKLAYFEGEHLRLISNTAEKRIFNLNKPKKRQRYEVETKTLTPFYQLAVLESNINKQRYAIKKTTALKKGQSSCVVNLPVLAVRKIASLLNVSKTKAHTLTKDLTPFGLCLTPNRQCITARDYFTSKANADHTVRWNKQEGNYYRLGASIASIKSLFKSATTTYTKTGYSYCNDCS